MRGLTSICLKRSNHARPVGIRLAGVLSEPMMESITLMVSAPFARKGGVCAASAREENVA
jgi:hypothetical protein